MPSPKLSPELAKKRHALGVACGQQLRYVHGSNLLLSIYKPSNIRHAVPGQGFCGQVGHILLSQEPPQAKCDPRTFRTDPGQLFMQRLQVAVVLSELEISKGSKAKRTICLIKLSYIGEPC